MNIQTIKDYTLNLKGWRTTEKIIVIQSDDWGSIRMPSNKVLHNLKQNSDIKLSNAYTIYDTLATTEDLEVLFEALSSVKDKNGNPAVLTANCLLANPDFKKIKDSHFESYHYEHITETFKNYNNENALKLWQKGIEEGLFIPQFHGKEHVNIPFWLETLQKNNKAVRQAFDYGTFGLSFNNIGYKQNNFQRAWDILVPESEQEVNQSISEGLKMFESYFGFKSITAIPPNYTWSKSQELLLKQGGVIALQGMLRQRIVNGADKPYTYTNRYTSNYKGQNNYLSYQRRNVFFEPSQGKINNIVETAINRIGISFRMSKPAIIGSHRVNFIGALNEKNREDNISMFRDLLSKIIKKWPDVVFMSSADLAKKMNNDK